MSIGMAVAIDNSADLILIFEESKPVRLLTDSKLKIKMKPSAQCVEMEVFL